MRFAGRILILIVLSLLLPSCGGGARQRVAVEGVESVARLGWSGFEAVLTVRNDLGRDVSLDECRILFRTESGTLAQADLRGGATVARRSTGSVTLRFRITSVNPSAMQALWRRLAAGDLGAVLVDVEAAVRTGGRERKIYVAERSLSEILSNFGVPDQIGRAHV